MVFFFFLPTCMLRREDRGLYCMITRRLSWQSPPTTALLLRTEVRKTGVAAGAEVRLMVCGGGHVAEGMWHRR